MSSSFIITIITIERFILKIKCGLFCDIWHNKTVQQKFIDNNFTGIKQSFFIGNCTLIHLGTNRLNGRVFSFEKYCLNLLFEQFVSAKIYKYKFLRTIMNFLCCQRKKKIWKNISFALYNNPFL